MISTYPKQLIFFVGGGGGYYLSPYLSIIDVIIYLSDRDPLVSCDTEGLKHLVLHISQFINDKLRNSEDLTGPAQP